MREDQTVATTRLLFVCVENSNHSQMAEAFARIHGGEDIEAYSAGSQPSGEVNTKAIAAMHEVGYDLSKQNSKSLEDIPTSRIRLRSNDGLRRCVSVR